MYKAQLRNNIKELTKVIDDLDAERQTTAPKKDWEWLGRNRDMLISVQRALQAHVELNS